MKSLLKNLWFTAAHTLLTLPSFTCSFFNISVLITINQSDMEVSNMSGILVVAKIGTKHEYFSLLKLGLIVNISMPET